MLLYLYSRKGPYCVIMNKTALKFISILFCIALLSPVAYAIEDSAVAGTGSDAVYGTETINYLSTEVSIGSLAADAAKYASGADLAIINSGDLNANLLGGEITYADCVGVFAEDRELAVTTITPKQLKALLEIAVGRIIMNEEQMTDREASAWGGFPQIAGFTFQYDVGQLVGNRVRWIKIDDEELILTDDETVYTLCASSYMLSGGWEDFEDLGGGEPIDITLSEALFSYIQSEGTVTPPGTIERIYTAGSKDYGIFDSLGISPLFLLLACILYGTVRTWKFKPYYDFER